MHRRIRVVDPVAHLKSLVKGEELMWGGFTSTSKSLGTAFTGNVRFQTQCSLGIDAAKAGYAPATVARLSAYPNENEALYPPHVKFRVVNIEPPTVFLETVEFPSVWDIIDSGHWDAFQKCATANPQRLAPTIAVFP